MAEAAAEATVVERSVAEMVARAESPERTNTVVTQENFNQWVDEKIGKPAAPAGEDSGDGAYGEDTGKGATGEDSAKPADPKAEPKEGDQDGGKVYFRGKWVPKHDFDYRLHVKTEEKTKAEQDARKAAETKARQAQERADAAERQANELRQKYEPPKPDDLGPEPKPEQFKDAAEYGKALKDWTGENVRREEAQKRQHEERVKSWDARKAAARKELSDFDEVIEAAKDVQLSGALTEAVLDSEIGPKILHKLAKDRDLVDALNKMPAGRMLREVGKLEAQLSAPSAKAEPEKPATPIAEVSKAPPPISPIKAAGTGVTQLRGSDPVPANMSYEDWKAARQAGRIK